MDVKIRKPFDGDFPITFKFGEKPQWYLNYGYGPHNGTDFGLPDGTPVLACDGAIVERVGFDGAGWGVFVRLRHKWGLSHYAHLSEPQVSVGQEVKKGQQIGKSGSTGTSTGPHLHFGIRINGMIFPDMNDWVNPEDYLDKPVIVEAIKCPKCGFCFPDPKVG